MNRRAKKTEIVTKPEPPKAAFFIYFDEVQSNLKKKDPKLKQSQISKKAKEMFDKLSDEEIQKYKELEEKAQEKYNKDLMEYKKKNKDDSTNQPEESKSQTRNVKKNKEQTTDEVNEKEKDKEKEKGKESVKKPVKKELVKKSNMTFTIRYCSGLASQTISNRFPSAQIVGVPLKDKQGRLEIVYQKSSNGDEQEVWNNRKDMKLKINNKTIDLFEKALELVEED